jgi:hypothetical protein
MRRTLILVAVLVAFVAFDPVTAAQPTENLLIYAYNTSAQTYGLVVVDASGKVLNTLASFPTGTYIYGLTMAEDNKSYRAVGYRYQAPSYTGFIFDVSAGGVVNTLASGLPLYRPMGMIRNCDGDWYVLNQGTTYNNIDILMLRGNKVSTLSTAANLYRYGHGLDPDTGQLVIRGMTRTAPYTYGYFRVDPTTGTVTQFAVYKTTTSTYYGAKSLIYEARSGALIDLTYDTSARVGTMVRVHPEIGITKMPYAAMNAYAYDLVKAGQRVQTHAYSALGRTTTSPYTYGLFRIDATGKGQGMSSLSFTPYTVSPVLRIGSRHLSWTMNAAPNDRYLDLSFPGEGGLNYAVGLTLSGVRPGPLLSDGREIPLVVDEATLLSLTGGVPGVLENTVGVLSAQGRAQVRINLNAFGSALKGLKIWATALVIDPQASSAVAYIEGPSLLRITQ